MNVGTFFLSFGRVMEGLLEAKTIKGALSVIGAWVLKSLVPVGGFLFVGLIVVGFQVVTSAMVNVKKGDWFWDGVGEVFVKLLLYPSIVVMTTMVQVTYLDWAPLVKLVSGYLVLHEVEISIVNVRELTGWNLTGIVEYVKIITKKRIGNGKK